MRRGACAAGRPERASSADEDSGRLSEFGEPAGWLLPAAAAAAVMIGVFGYLDGLRHRLILSQNAATRLAASVALVGHVPPSATDNSSNTQPSTCRFRGSPFVLLRDHLVVTRRKR